MATDPQFAAAPARVLAQVSTANTNRDGTGTLVTVLTAGSSGTRIDSIRAVAEATTTAGMIRFYLHDGTNARLFDELPVTVVTPSASVAAWSTDRTYAQLVLPTGWTLRASTHNAATFDIHVEAANL